MIKQWHEMTKDEQIADLSEKLKLMTFAAYAMPIILTIIYWCIGLYFKK